MMPTAGMPAEKCSRSAFRSTRRTSAGGPSREAHAVEVLRAVGELMRRRIWKIGRPAARVEDLVRPSEEVRERLAVVAVAKPTIPLAGRDVVNDAPYLAAGAVDPDVGRHGP